MTRLDEFVKPWPKHFMHEGPFTDSGIVRAQLDGLLGWWATAGVDCAVGEESVDWLRPQPARKALAPAPSPPVSPSMGEAVSTAKSGPEGAGSGWPGDMPSFLDWLAQARDLPESRWPGRRILPAGPSDAPRLMIVLPAPDMQADDASGAPLPAEAMRLLDNMLRATGLSLDQCHIATMSLIAPPGGMLDPDIIAPLLRRMHHHIALVRPEALLLAGDQTNRAFAPMDGIDSDRNLPFVNHGDGKVPCASILHPRLILGQSSAKAGIWKSLRTLFGGQRH